MSDPRIREVTSTSRHSRNDVSLVLSCGHVQRRKLRLVPSRAICIECPVPVDWAAQNLGRRAVLPEVTRPIADRLAVARDQMVARKRTPRVFYLDLDDYAAFLATEAGRSVANPPDGAQSVDALHSAVRGKLAAPLQKFFDVLLRHYPDSIARSDWAAEAGYEPNSGTADTYRSRVLSLDLADAPERGQVRAADWLFP